MALNRDKQQEPISIGAGLMYSFILIGLWFVCLALFGLLGRVMFEAFMLGWRVMG